MRQIPLKLTLTQNASFGNFLAGGNQPLLDFLPQFLRQPQAGSLLIYGLPGVGLSHILQACCQQQSTQGFSAIYLPLDKAEIQPQMLDGLEQLSLICIDDVHSKLGNTVWEEGLFHCYNRVQQQGGKLLMASHIPPQQFSCSLPDLQSRLLSSLVFQVKPLTDDEKISALRQNARERGMLLSDDIASYLLNRFPRDLPALFKVLDELDQATLSQQRRLTIPFIKAVLGS